MGKSSLTGADRATAQPPGRDSGALGPSDASDSGSDVQGSGAERDDGSATDGAGTGERRVAAGRDLRRDAPDISADRVIDSDGTELDDAEDPDLAFVDDLRDDEAPDEDGTTPL